VCGLAVRETVAFAVTGHAQAKRLELLLNERPIVVFAVFAPGSTCHHLQSLQSPHSDFAVPFGDVDSFRYNAVGYANAAPIQAACVWEGGRIQAGIEPDPE